MKNFHTTVHTVVYQVFYNVRFILRAQSLYTITLNATGVYNHGTLFRQWIYL